MKKSIENKILNGFALAYPGFVEEYGEGKIKLKIKKDKQGAILELFAKNQENVKIPIHTTYGDTKQYVIEQMFSWLRGELFKALKEHKDQFNSSMKSVVLIETYFKQNKLVSWM